MFRLSNLYLKGKAGEKSSSGKAFQEKSDIPGTK